MITTPKRLIAPRNDYAWIAFDIVEHLMPVLRQGDGAGGASIVRPASNICVHVFEVSLLTAPPENRFDETALRGWNSNPGHHELSLFHRRAAYLNEQFLASTHVHDRLIRFA